MAAVLKFLVTVDPIVAFLLILAISFAASIVTCVLTKPESDTVLKRFYLEVRPWGFWGPVLEKCRRDDPTIHKNRDFSRDMFNVSVGLVWQTVLVTVPIYLVIQHWRQMWISAVLFVVTSVILKFSWYDRLGPGQMYTTKDGQIARDA